MKGAMQMTADSSAGAVSHLSTDWHAIPWKTVNETVRRLQARIVQATKAGKWHKVQALQHLVVYTTAADNSLNPKTRYNVPLTPSSAGALPWYQPSFSTTSVSWRWCASS
jgi:RNA-directed DNA polymerase